MARKVRRTATALTRRPVPLGEGERLTRWDYLDAVGDTLPFPSSWSFIPQLTQRVAAARGADQQGQPARQWLAGLKQRPNFNEGMGFSVVNCLDSPTGPPAASRRARPA